MIEQLESNKFIIINKKHLKKVPYELLIEFLSKLQQVEVYLPKHEYIACNKDEPYAIKIAKIILKEEKA